MLEVKKHATVSGAQLAQPKLHLFINNRLVILEGDWEWNLHASEVFCSDVFFMLALPNDFEGTRAFIYPDDLEDLKENLSNLNPDLLQYFSFRIITTHGSVEVIKGEGVFKTTVDEAFAEKLLEQETEQYLQQKQAHLNAIQNQELLYSYRLSEQQHATGVWFVNTTTHEIHYSDGIFDIYELPPQSLNAHLHTFNAFLYHEDQEAVVNAFEAAYAAQAPLQLEFRIVTTNGTIKFIRQGISWKHNEKGDWMLYGTLEDITGEREMVAGVEGLQDEIVVQKALLQNNEQSLKSANWYINLITRKAVYTEGIFRLYGIKNKDLILNTNTLLSFVHPDDYAMVADAHKRIFREHQVPELEFRIIQPDGKTRYLKQKGKLVINAAKELIITATTHDITDEITRDTRITELKSQHTVTEFAYGKTEELSGIGSWMWNVGTGEITWSSGLYTLLGFKNANIKPSPKFLLSMVHPDDKDLFSHEITEMLEGKKESTFHFKLVRKDGNRFIEATFKLLTADDHSLFIGTLHDHTALYQIETQLKEQVRLAELLGDASPDIMIVTDSNNTVFRWNRPSEEKYSIKKEQAIGKNIFDMFPALRTAEVLQNFQKALNGEKIVVKGAKGIITKGMHNLVMQPIKDEDGQVIAVLHLLHDVTQELELKHELTHRLEFIERLLSASVDLVIVLDKHMNYQYWNKRAEEYYGIAKEEVIGRNILDIFPAFVNDPSYQEIRTSLRGEVVHIPANENLQAKKGYYETYLIPVKDDKGEVASVLWIVHDLSKEFILQRDRKKTLETLDALNENYFELNEGFRFTYVNKKAFAFFEKSKEDLYGTVIWDAFPELVDTPLYFAITHTLEDQVTTAGEFIFPAKEIPVYVSIVPSIDGIIIGFFDISNVKETEKKLIEHQNFIQQITEASPDVVTVFDLQTNESIYVNKTLAGMLGYSMSDIEDMGHEGRLKTIIYSEDRKKLLALNKQVALAKDNEIQSLDYRLVCKDGAIKWVKNRCKVFKRNEGGEVTHLLSVIQDITEQVETGEKLKESELFLGNIMAASVDYIMVFDLLKEKTIFVNRSAYKGDEERYQETLDLDYASILERAHPVDRQPLHNYIQSFKTATDNEIASIEYRVTKGEDVVWYKSRGKVFKRDTAGKPLQYISVVQDISEEVDLRNKLAERIAYAEKLIDSSVDCIFVINDAFIVRAWNYQCAVQYGIPKEEALGKSLLQLFPPLQNDHVMLQQIKKALAGEHVYLSAEKEVQGDAVSEKFLIPLQNGEGKTASVLVVLHDVTAIYKSKDELKNLNVVLDQQNKDLAQKNDEITSFAFVASHDLREPLRKIHTFSDWLLEQENDNLSAMGRNYLQRICGATQRMQMLLQDILVLSKIHSIKKEMVSIDLNKVLEEVKKDLQTEINSSGAEIKYKALPSINSDYSQQYYLFRNLLHNSIKFQKPGNKPVIEIKVKKIKGADADFTKADRDTIYLVISIKDNGIGIEEKYFSKIFQVFQQLQGKQEGIGTGMGLAICRKVMQNHKGYITVNSSFGEGSVFSCYFPISDQE